MNDEKPWYPATDGGGGRVFEIGARWFRVFFRDSKTEGQEGRSRNDEFRFEEIRGDWIRGAIKSIAALEDVHDHFSRGIHFIS